MSEVDEVNPPSKRIRLDSEKAKQDSSNHCIKCGKSRKKINAKTDQLKKIQNDTDKSKYEKLLNKPVNIGDFVCSGCRLGLLDKSIKDLSGSTSEKNSSASTAPDNYLATVNYTDESTSAFKLIKQLSGLTTSSSASSQGSIFTPPQQKKIEETVELPFKRVNASHKRCCVCLAVFNKNSPSMLVPLDARIQTFSVLKIFINKTNRCCPNHILKKRFIKNELTSTFNNFPVYSNVSDVEVSEVKLFLEKLSAISTNTIHIEIGEFSLSEDRLKVFTGFTYDQIKSITEMLPNLRSSNIRNPFQAVVIFLFKLRTGCSDELANAILEVKDHQSISNCWKSVITAFEKNVLPTKFGVNSVTREDLISNHTSYMAKKLYNTSDDTLVLICDGTYVYHQKSKNNVYQRKSYSGHKKAPLCKPFTICCTDGFVLDLPGPYYANQNDAYILKKVLEDPNGISKILKKGDIFVLDRGFRDVVDYLNTSGYQVYMPALKGKKPKLTTAESNASRFVTKVRWVVEVIHGIIGKKFKFLHNEIHNKTLPNVGSLTRIANFLNNMFGKRLQSDKGICDEVINRMFSQKDVKNTLAEEVDKNKWNRKKVIFAEINSNALNDFPELEIAEMKIFFTGTYQLSLAVCYLAELMDKNDEISVKYYKQKSNIIRFKVQSRHRESKAYNSYIEYEPEVNCMDGIKRYCCDCPNGDKTVGCCCHIAAIIYFLSNARFETKIIRPAELLTNIFDAEEYEDIVPVLSDSEGSDDEEE